MGQALYRKYRSKTLDEIVGQSHITNMLSRAIANNRIAHAYLLTGPRGVGKTSIARILAHQINQLPYTDESSHLDIIEIDAASNNGVDDIRDLREKAQVAPVSAKRKVYIIDEVHMLSKPAFNALLKTLEEPPEHVVFILATTDVEKLPATIISRVQRFNFRTITEADLTAHLRTIADAEGIEIADDALELIARQGSGSFRDSISLLDQLANVSDGPISRELIESVLGLADVDTVTRLLEAYETQDIGEIVRLLHNSESRGTPAVVLTEQLIRTIRERIVEQPYLLPLLDRLLDIARSAWPHVKLLTALTADVGAHHTRRPLAPPPAVEATVPVQAAQPPTTSLKSRPTKNSTVPKAPQPVPDNPKSPTSVFPWADFLQQVKEQSMGAYTLLAQCGYDYANQTLTIYAGKAFTKNRLLKAQTELQAALQAVGVNDATLLIEASPKPARDSQTAAILDIMGGGEEVSL